MQLGKTVDSVQQCWGLCLDVHVDVLCHSIDLGHCRGVRIILFLMFPVHICTICLLYIFGVRKKSMPSMLNISTALEGSSGVRDST